MAMDSRRSWRMMYLVVRELVRYGDLRRAVEPGRA